MVAHLFVADNLLCVNCQRQTACKWQYLRHTLDECGQPVPQIMRQESAVRSRIRRQFLFVKRLRVIERLLRRITVNSVRVPLQRGQVVELGRLLFLLPAFNLLDRRLFAMAGGSNPFRFLSRFYPSALRRKAAAELHRIKSLDLKRRNLFFPLRHHRQRRGHDAPDIELGSVEPGIQPCSVDAHQPVRLRTAQSRTIQRVVGSARLERPKPLADGTFLKRRNPEPLDGLGAARLFIHHSENQLSLAPRIRRAHHFVHIRSIQQVFQHGKLLLCPVADHALPCARHNRQILPPPLRIACIIDFRRGKLDQMPDTPAHKVVLALQISVFLLICAQYGGNALRHAGLFCKNHSHPVILHFRKKQAGSFSPPAAWSYSFKSSSLVSSSSSSSYSS